VEETFEADEEAVGTIKLADWVLLTLEDATVEEIGALELLRALDEFPPAAFPDLEASSQAVIQSR
jgi:hypothetical protein